MNTYLELKEKLLEANFTNEELRALGINENTFKDSEIDNFLKNREELDGLKYAMSVDLNDLYECSVIQRG